ncbi:GlsB/YeaQ/YmgE family stress response membrane protein [Demequina pelophila]|uniref:GlsB/YeaQ/YmgE family stress response membrane protein n=1 Tax=Demequina pelophila TaxID=1638984 RepID=UPI000785FA39|nr:GlsB/YeaQ/YmgE family stress response membrane protein [Demequina pelophila]
MGWLLTILAGLGIGILARVIMPGKQNIGILVTILLGVGGAIGGRFVWTNLLGGGDTDGIDWISLGLSVAVAMVLIAIWTAVFSKKS